MSNAINFNMSGKEEVISAMEQREKVQEKYLPKVDHKLIIDFFLHMREEPNEKEGLNQKRGLKLQC